MRMSQGLSGFYVNFNVMRVLCAYACGNKIIEKNCFHVEATYEEGR